MSVEYWEIAMGPMPCSNCGHPMNKHPMKWNDKPEHEGDYNYTCTIEGCECLDFMEVGWV